MEALTLSRIIEKCVVRFQKNSSRYRNLDNKIIEIISPGWQRAVSSM